MRSCFRLMATRSTPAVQFKTPLCHWMRWLDSLTTLSLFRNAKEEIRSGELWVTVERARICITRQIRTIFLHLIVTQVDLASCDRAVEFLDVFPLKCANFESEQSRLYPFFSTTPFHSIPYSCPVCVFLRPFFPYLRFLSGISSFTSLSLFLSLPFSSLRG